MSVIAFPSAPEAGALSSHDAGARRDALDVRNSFIVEAPAGSGKTGLLIQRYLRLLAIVDQPEAVLALTFTRKAAAEMRDRVLAALNAGQQPLAEDAEEFDRETWTAARAVISRDTERGWNLQEQPHRLSLKTIDSLCTEIARAAPVLSGGMGQATPIEHAMPLYRAAARAVLLQLGGEDTVLNEAVESVLLHRDADLGDCETLLAQMLATREQWASLIPLGRESLDDAALDANVRPRLEEALDSALCAELTKIQKRFKPGLLQQVASLAHMLAEAEGYKDEPNPLMDCAGLPHVPGTSADDIRHWEMLAHLLVTATGEWRKGLNVNHVGLRMSEEQKFTLLQAIEELRHDDTLQSLLCGLRELPPRHYPDDQWRVAKSLFRLLYNALGELRLLFARGEVCDFAELSLAARAALGAGDADRMGMRLEHLLVDEMQDTSTAQYDLLELLTAGWNGVDQTVFLVGDPKQSIYGFRQAKVEHFMKSMRTGMLRHIPLRPLHLTSNFRSGAGLVRALNQTFAAVFQDDGPIGYKKARAARTETACDQLEWHSMSQAKRTDGASKREEARREHRGEAEAIASTVQTLQRLARKNVSGAPRTMAVLVRTRRHALHVVQKLADADIAFRAVGMETLAERPEVLDVLAITRALLHPADRTAWLAVLRAPWCGLTLSELHLAAGGDDRSLRKGSLRIHLRERAALLPADVQLRLQRTLDVLDDAVAHRGRAPIAAEVDRVWHALQANLCVTARQHRNVRAYVELLERMEAAGETVDLTSLAEQLKGLYADAESDADAVDVLTIHKAKGLEWDAVFVPGMHRSSQSGKAPLLDWAELGQTDTEGHPLILLAPIHRRGDERGSLNKFVSGLRTQDEQAELQRLFYVAATRARTALHLFAAPQQKTDGTLSIRSNTLLRAAGTTAERHFQQLPATLPLPFPAVPRMVEGLALAASAESWGRDDALSAGGFVALRRLPLAAIRTPVLRQAPGLSAPSRLHRAHQPAGSLAARVLGTTVHAFLQHLAELMADPHAAVPDVAAWSQRILTLVRMGGLSGSDTERVCGDVEAALQNTLADPLGRWVLGPHPEAINEGELFDTSKLAARDSPLDRYRFDRSFLAGMVPGGQGSNALWIVDYKTSTRRGAEIAGAARDEFLAAERSRYSPALHTYARLALQSARPGTPVMLALYYPMLPHLDYWSYDPEAEKTS